MFGKIHSLWKHFMLTESAKTAADVVSDNDLSVEIKLRSFASVGGLSTIDIQLVNFANPEEHDLIAEIEIREAKIDIDGECNKCYVVSWSKAEVPGWGPLMYDLALEVVGSAGLAPDRAAVSDKAEAVWQFYLKNRKDIRWKQLDDEFGNLTPENPQDDCSQTAARRRIPDSPPKEKKWVASALSKVYYKTGTPLLDLLRRHGKIIDHRRKEHGAKVRSN